jgi:hypothetical protein
MRCLLPPEAIAAALHEVADDRSVELIVEVGDPGRRGRVPGNPKLIISACEGRLAVGALIAPERAVYYLVGDQAVVGEVAFTFGGQPGGTWPRRYLVDVDHAIAVAQDLLGHGRRGAVHRALGPRVLVGTENDRGRWVHSPTGQRKAEAVPGQCGRRARRRGSTRPNRAAIRPSNASSSPCQRTGSTLWPAGTI